MKKENDELLYYGINICNTIFNQRKNDIIKVYIDNTNVGKFNQLLKFCANAKKTYHIITNQELDKVCDSTHHNGIAILAKSKRIIDFKELSEKFKNSTYTKPIVFLDNVKNPHNIGIIARTMAHYGITTLVTNSIDKINGSMARMSEGGIEFVDLYYCKNYKDLLDFSKNYKFKIITTSSHTSKSIYQYKIENQSIIVFGDEVEGISKEMIKISNDSIIIPGTNNIESINVSVACGIILSEYYRNHENR